MKLFRSMLLIGALAPWGTFIATAQTAAPAREKKAAPGKKVAPSSPIDLNTATQAELESIPGVGTPTAKKIVAGRPYSSPSDLAKAGISAKTIQDITPMVKVSSAPGRAMPAPTSRAMPAPMPRSAPATQTSTMPPAASNQTRTNTAEPPSGPGQTPPSPGMVWVNMETKVYHRSGDRWYGKTKKGKFMNEQDAQKAGYRETKEK